MLATMSSYRGRGRIRDPTIPALIRADESEHGGFNILSVTPRHCIFCPLIYFFNIPFAKQYSVCFASIIANETAFSVNARSL
jgi:hypothetical protein